MERREAWKSMNAQKEKTLKWFKEARYGMFIHWGLYSQLGGVYQGKKMEEGRPPRVAEWIMHAHNIPRDEYRRLADDFNPVKFDAAQWVSLAKAAGMKYMVLTSKHHDGFALFDSDVSDFTITQASPFKRDVVKELYEECRKQGLAFGLYYSHSIDWMDGGDGGQKDYSAVSSNNTGLHAYNEWDPSPVSYREYFYKKSLPQVKEILTRYPGMKILWCDVNYHIPEDFSYDLYKLASDASPETIICERIGNDMGDYAIPGDNIIPESADEYGGPWETVGTMNNSWGFKSYDHDWKSPGEVLFWIVDILSKGGNYMLNIGPRGDGTVPKESVRILKEVGAWLRKNGEAVYGTGRWKFSHEGPAAISMKGTNDREDKKFTAHFSTRDFWFTAKGDQVYAFSLAGLLPEFYEITSLAGARVTRVTHLGSGKECDFSQTDSSLILSTKGLESEELGHVFRFDF